MKSHDYSDAIVTRWPNRRNIAPFSNFSGVVWTLPKVFKTKWRGTKKPDLDCGHSAKFLF